MPLPELTHALVPLTSGQSFAAIDKARNRLIKGPDAENAKSSATAGLRNQFSAGQAPHGGIWAKSRKLDKRLDNGKRPRIRVEPSKTDRNRAVSANGEHGS